MEISKELKDRLIEFLYKELECDTTNVEINELLDGLEGKESKYED